LLDIELEDGTSFELLEKLNHENFLAIFITGFNDLAIRAIKVGALDYLVKPIADDEFQEAIQRVIDKTVVKSITKEQLNVSNDFFKGIKNKRLVLRTFDTHFIIYEADIMYCHSEGNYTTYFMVDKSKIVVSKSMKKVEELLSKSFFIKCHQSYLVNINYIEQYKVDGYLILQGNIKIPIATRRKDFVTQKIQNF
jgi:two-component system LytT family response regulator